MASSQPPWLSSFLKDNSPAPRIYSWTPEPEPYTTLSPAHDNPRRIYILGIGNIGRLYAAYLSKHPNAPPITLVLHRRELLSGWHESPGIEITRQGITERTTKLNVEYWTDDPPSGEGSATEVGPISNLIIATKADTALQEADRLRRYLNSSSTVAFAQNGMCKLWPPHGSAYVAHRFPDQASAPNFAACITTHGVISLAPFRSKHASLADAKVGLVLPNARSAERAEYLLQTVATAPQLDSHRESRADLWVLQLEKLVVNTVINPMTAVLRCQNGVLFAEQQGVLVNIMDRLLEETSPVFQALVRHPSTSEILSTSLNTDCSRSLETARQKLIDRFAVKPLRDMLWGVGYKVKENTSSMLQDVRAGKKTEIRDFNGWIVDMAHFLDPNLDVSSHEKLIDLVEDAKVLDPAQLGEALLNN